MDYIFRWLGMEFIEGYREANSPRGDGRNEPKAPERNGAGTRTGLRRIVPTTPHHARRRAHRSPLTRAIDQRETTVSESSITATNASGGSERMTTQSSTLSIALDAAGDAPPCDVCGTITVRSGTCYKCLNCGNSMGCS